MLCLFLLWQVGEVGIVVWFYFLGVKVCSVRVWNLFINLLRVVYIFWCCFIVFNLVNCGLISIILKWVFSLWLCMWFLLSILMCCGLRGCRVVWIWLCMFIVNYDLFFFLGWCGDVEFFVYVGYQFVYWFDGVLQFGLGQLGGFGGQVWYFFQYFFVQW